MPLDESGRTGNDTFSIDTGKMRLQRNAPTHTCDPLALSLAKLCLVWPFRLCYFNDLNSQTHQVCGPQANVKYLFFSVFRFSHWPKRGEREAKTFTIRSALKKVSTLTHIVCHRFSVFFSLLFLFFFLHKCDFIDLSTVFMTCGCSFWNIFFVLFTLLPDGWLLMAGCSYSFNGSKQQQ